MEFDKRERSIIFNGWPELPKPFIEEGDEATLHHKGNLLLAKISTVKGNQMVGTITRSACDTDLYPELTVGKEIRFLEQNIFGISKLKRKS